MKGLAPLVIFSFAMFCASDAHAGTKFRYRCPQENKDFGVLKLGRGMTTPPESSGFELAYFPKTETFEGIKVRRQNFPDASAPPVAGTEDFMGEPVEYVIRDGEKAYLYSGHACPVCKTGKLERTILGFWE